MRALKNAKGEIFYSKYLQEHYLLVNDLARRREQGGGLTLARGKQTSEC